MSETRAGAGFVAALLLIFPAIAYGQAAERTGRPVATATRTATPPTVDGLLDDAVWKQLTPVSNFTQRPGRPVEGGTPSERTEVSIAYDDEHLYFGIHAFYKDTSTIRASRVDRDQIQPDDKVTIYLDPFLDLQRAYGFAVNPYGVQRDAVLTATGGPGGDANWNALYDSAGQIVEDGWTAEMRIPFKSLRYPARDRGVMHRWGIQLERDIESKNEALTWSPISSRIIGFITQMGELEGLSDLSTNRNLEFLPTVTAIQVGALNTRTGAYTTDHGQEAGLNVKYGVTPNMTVDFTANPDFSQIGTDRPQIEVNQRFPIQYPELRPFFLEGQEIYGTPSPITLVHTRTIVDPRFGGKLTGKTGKTTLAILVADDEAPGKGDDPLARTYGESATALTSRVKYDVYPRSYLGAIFTDREFLNSNSRLGGVDGDFWIGRVYRFNFDIIGSSRTSLSDVHRAGPQWNFSFRRDGRSLDYSVVHYRTHPDFGTDLGFVRRVDQQYTTSQISYTFWPGNRVRQWGPSFTYERGYDYDGVVLNDEKATTRLSATLARNITIGGGVDQIMERYRDINFDKTRFSANANINTSRKVAVGFDISVGDEIRFVANPFLGHTTVFGLDLTVRPSPRLQSTINLDTTKFTDPATNAEVFDIKILHAVTTYQFTDRFLVRNILDHNTNDRSLFTSFLFTYRVNSGTVFYTGFDGNFRQGDRLDPVVFPTTDYRRTNRSVFAKLQYLYRM